MDSQISQGEVTSTTPRKPPFVVPKSAGDNAISAPVVHDTRVSAIVEEPVASADSTVATVQPQGIDVAKGIESSQLAETEPFSIDTAKPLILKSFPNLDNEGNILSTIPNAQHLLRSYGITVRYNVISKKLLIVVPGYSGTPDNAANVSMTLLYSLAALNGMSAGQLPSYVSTIGDRNQFNPIAEWITSKPWDGVDRLQAMCDTLVHREDFPTQLKRTLLHRWLISAVAAALKPIGFKARGVLTLQGPQLLGKTTWISSLVPDPILREGTVKLDHHLDAGNKDSLITAVSHWIVEIGELDSSFKKDVARLKGFLTGERDKVRRPYARADSEYPRRTVFAATVNESNFLVDATGNSRFWTIPVTKVIYDHGIDMQQLFAQMAVDFNNGKQWWLMPEEDALLDEQNKLHRSVSVIHERLLDSIDMSKIGDENLPAMTATEVLIQIGIKHPTNPQSKECAAVLREHLGESKRIKGQNKWRVSIKQTSYSSTLEPHKSKPASQYKKPADDDDQF